jgi:hypothetical protein
VATPTKPLAIVVPGGVNGPTAAPFTDPLRMPVESTLIWTLYWVPTVMVIGVTALEALAMSAALT